MKKILLLGLVVCIGSVGLASNVQILTPAQVYNEIKKNDVTVLDVNPEAIYKKGHVPKAKNTSFLNTEGLLPKNKKSRIIFYCMNEMCSASHQAAETAVKAGYSNVARMSAGIAGWIQQKLPIETTNN